MRRAQPPVEQRAAALIVGAGPVSADAGRGFACGLGAAGELYCWGSNSVGQLGIGSTLPEAAAPQRVAAALGSFSAVSAGAEHACAIAGGALYCWGGNLRGQLGDNTTTNRSTLVRVGSAGDWSAVSAGVTHTCGLRGSALYCWGGNFAGQLGVGSLTDVRTPSPVAGSYQRVASGEAHTCALEAATARLYCFGNNSYGQLGLSGTQNRTTPTLVSSDAYAGLDAGAGHTCPRCRPIARTRRSPPATAPAPATACSSPASGPTATASSARASPAGA